MKIYIAGKMTGDPDYRAKFSMAQRAIEGDGHIVINPAMLPGELTNAEYMRICFSMIDVAEVVVFLPDWLESEGARLEKGYCLYTGKKIRTAEPDEMNSGRWVL